jgi:hypothetical protein
VVTRVVTLPVALSWSSGALGFVAVWSRILEHMLGFVVVFFLPIGFLV